MIKSALDAYAATLNKSWLLDRGMTVGASAVGGCARKVWFEKNADDPSAPQPDPEFVDSYGAKIRGTVIEDDFWAPALKHVYGENLLYAGPEQRTFVKDFLSATPDGLLINQPADALAHLGVPDIEGTEIVVESKSLDSRFNIDNLPKPENVFQVHCQIGLIRALTNHKPTFGVISYIDAGWWDLCHERVVRYSPAVFKTAELRARDIMLADSALDLKPEGVIAGGKECAHCAFTRACGAARAAYVPRVEKVLTPAEISPIAAQARIAKNLKAEADRFAGEAREAEAKLRDMLSEAGTRKVDGGGVKVRWSAVKGRSMIDNAAFREAALAAGVDITRFQKIGAVSDSLVIGIEPDCAAATP